METRKTERFSISSVQYLLCRISFEEGIVTPKKMVTYKSNYPRWVIKQILIQVEKQQERNNLNNNNNNGESNTNNENNFPNENDKPDARNAYIIHYITIQRAR